MDYKTMLNEIQEQARRQEKRGNLLVELKCLITREQFYKLRGELDRVSRICHDCPPTVMDMPIYIVPKDCFMDTPNVYLGTVPEYATKLDSYY